MDELSTRPADSGTQDQGDGAPDPSAAPAPATPDPAATPAAEPADEVGTPRPEPAAELPAPAAEATPEPPPADDSITAPPAESEAPPTIVPTAAPEDTGAEVTAAEAEPATETESAAEGGPVAESEPAAEAEPTTGTEPAAEGGPVAEREPAAEAEPVAETEPAAEAEPVAEEAPGAAPGHPPKHAGEPRMSEAHAAKARDNAAKLEAEIERLREAHKEGEQHSYRTFFEGERRLHALFKDLRPLHAADRHRLWNTFKQIGVEVRRAQQEEWESRRYQSIEARESVEEKIRGAEALTLDAQKPDDYRKADALLNEARALLSNDVKGSPGTVLIGPDRRACWERWREVRDVLRQRRGGLQEHDYESLAGPVTAVVEEAKTGDAFKAIQRIKALQAQLGHAFLRRGQFEELRRRLSDAWQAAQARVSEQRQERSRQRSEWRERMEGHLTRWRETLGHKQSQREHLLAQMEKLEGMEKSSRSEEFTVQVRGWKDETIEKLRRVDEFIADLEERIRSATKKLGGRAGRAGGGPAATGHAQTSEAPGHGSTDEAPPHAEGDEPPGMPEPPEPDEPAES